MNLFRHFEGAVAAAVVALTREGGLPEGLDASAISVEPPRDPGHGDVTTNAAMILARPAGRKPRELAEALSGHLAAMEGVERVAVAGPGFINLSLSPGFWFARLRDVLAAGTAYGDSTLGAGEPVNVEFVSANPTGPLHVGHGRGAVVGDALASLLAKAGFRVTREYYVNDAGGQVDQMARSIHFRYLVAMGARSQADFDRAREAGEIQYAGAYLQEVADAIRADDGARWVDAPEAAWLPVFRERGVATMLDGILASLARLGIHFDVIASERALVERGDVTDVIDALRQAGHIYTGVLEPPKGKLPDDWEPRPQTLFRATAFGDDIDRPLQKSDGAWTYFASDIAYHGDKFRRGFASMIDVWGADHGGYVKRMQAAVKAITGGAGDLDVKLCQMVNLLDRGQPVKMSKRAGTFVTLDEVVDRVGRDVFRFMMLTRKNDAQLDFDFAKVVEQTKDNPVFYVQYAHARCCSVLRHAAAELGDTVVDAAALAEADLGRLTDAGELAVIKWIAQWPRLVEHAAIAHEPHRIAFYLQDLASAFHLLWTRGKDETQLRFITVSDVPLSQARLALVRGVQLVVASGLGVFGVRPVAELR